MGPSHESRAATQAPVPQRDFTTPKRRHPSRSTRYQWPSPNTGRHRNPGAHAAEGFHNP